MQKLPGLVEIILKKNFWGGFCPLLLPVKFTKTPHFCMFFHFFVDHLVSSRPYASILFNCHPF